MEFVIVTCDGEPRTVFIDNQEQGVTDSRLSVPEGIHVFDLGVPLDYAPAFVEVLVENTTHLDPMSIPFSLNATRAAARRGRAGRRALKGTRKTAAGERARGTKESAETAAGKRAGGRKKTAGKPARGKKTGKKTDAARRSAKEATAKAKNRNKKR